MQEPAVQPAQQAPQDQVQVRLEERQAPAAQAVSGKKHRWRMLHVCWKRQQIRMVLGWLDSEYGGNGDAAQ